MAAAKDKLKKLNYSLPFMKNLQRQPSVKNEQKTAGSAQGRTID